MFGHILPELKMGLASLFAHKLRSLLTMLGMIFGVGAVVAMLSITAGAQKQMMSFIDQLGVNNIIVDAHEAMDRNELQAVRSGPWKLAVTPQGTGLPKGAAQPVKHTGPRLYNLDRDIGELTDVAAQHADVVARLQKLIEPMDADLGATGAGPGVRAPDRVEKPQPLLRRVGAEYD